MIDAGPYYLVRYQRGTTLNEEWCTSYDDAVARKKELEQLEDTDGWRTEVAVFVLERIG